MFDEQYTLAPILNVSLIEGFAVLVTDENAFDPELRPVDLIAGVFAEPAIGSLHNFTVVDVRRIQHVGGAGACASGNT